MLLDDAARAKIAPYVSSLDDDVFALTGLPEEVIAVLFAYYSRSKDDLRTNLAKLLADDDLDVRVGQGPARSAGFASDKARAFHEKWVVGYGHASVAEHAVVHLAIENVSIVCSKVIEDLRLGSYTEKSTRYVVFDTQSFRPLPELPESAASRYGSRASSLFATYLELFPRVLQALSLRVPRPEGTSEAAHTAALRAQTLDLLRGLLPAGTRTNLGLTANARALELLLTKMFSHPLTEVRETAARMLRAALHVAPTLVKYAAKSPYRAELPGLTEQGLQSLALSSALAQGSAAPSASGVRLLRHDPDAATRVALALGFEGSVAPLGAAALTAALEASTPAAVESFVRSSLGPRGRFDSPPRAFEAATLTFELELDYGAYRDLQRHRLLTPATQRLGCTLGFDVPEDLQSMGFAAPYEQALRDAATTWAELEEAHPLEAQYVVPLAYRLRTLWTLNLRELFHVVELRSSKQGHVSYRRIAQAMYREACRVHPWLAGSIRVDLEDYALSRA